MLATIHSKRACLVAMKLQRSYGLVLLSRRWNERSRRSFLLEIFDDDARAEQDGEHEGESDGQSRIRLDQHPEVNHAADGSQINELMQARPTLSAQPLDPAFGRGNRERNHQKEAEHPDGDERTRVDVINGAFDAERAVEPDVSQQMQEAIKEGVESEHPAKLDKPLDTGNFSERRDSERDQEEDERQHSRRPREKLHGVSPELVVIPVPGHQDERHEAVDEDGDFVKLDFFHRVLSRLEIDSQIHPRIQLPDLFRIAIEHQGVALSILADARLARLTPTRMVNARINV